MVIKTGSVLFRVLLVVANPVPWLPSIVPLRIEAARVGSDTTTWCKVSFGY